MDTDVIKAPAEFRLRMLALLVNSDWLARYGVVMRPEYFPAKTEQRFVAWVNDYWVKYRALPQRASLLNGMPEDEQDIVDTILDCDGEDLRYAADVAMEFARQQEMKIAVLKAVEDIKIGKLDRIESFVRDALKVGQDKQELGLDLIDDLDSWVGSELHGQRWPTGWIPADRALDGGLTIGEYGLCMAPPGMGKTTMLINIGYAMAGLLCKSNVLHVSCEIPKEQVLARYAARLAGVRLRRDDDSMTEDEFKTEVRKRGRQRLRGKLRVIDNLWTVDDIHNKIENLRSEGFTTQALIVDYADLLRPAKGREEKRFELADISRDLRAMGAELGFPVWSATQSGRESIYKEVITTANIAEAIEKAAVADVILALCQTKEEEELKQGRLFGAKIRKAESHTAWPVKINFQHQAIVTTDL